MVNIFCADNKFDKRETQAFALSVLTPLDTKLAYCTEQRAPQGDKVSHSCPASLRQQAIREMLQGAHKVSKTQV